MLVNATLPAKIEDGTNCLHVVHEFGVVIPIHIPSHIGVDSDRTFLEFYYLHYEPLKKRILHYIAALRKNPEDADDILQNVFKKLWENKNHLYKIGSPENYLFTMAKNDFLNSQRFLKRNKKTLQGYACLLDHQANTTDDMVLNKETETRLNKAMSELPVRMKKTLTLRIEGYKIDRIAGVMDISRSTVKNQLQAGIKKMQGSLMDK